MTYVVNDEEKDCVVPLLKPRDDNGDDCVKLGVSDDLGEAAGGAQQAASPVFVSRWCCLLWWAKMFVLLIFVGVLAAVFLLWVGPFFMDKVLSLSLSLLIKDRCMCGCVCFVRIYNLEISFFMWE